MGPRAGRDIAALRFAVRVMTLVSCAKTATIAGVVECAVAEVLGCERAADEHERRALDRLCRDLRADVAQGAPQDTLIGPARAYDDDGRAIGAVEGSELRRDAIDGRDGEMDGKRRARLGEGGEAFAFRHARGAPGNAR